MGRDCDVFHLYVVQSRNLSFMVRAERRQLERGRRGVAIAALVAGGANDTVASTNRGLPAKWV